MWTALRQLLDKRGLHPGREFESWLETTFSDRGVTSNLVLQADLAQVRTVLEAQGADFIKPRKISDGHFIDDPDAARALRPAHRFIPTRNRSMPTTPAFWTRLKSIN